MDILSVIPIGHENGITQEKLAKKLGVSERDVRRAITNAREHEVILNLKDGKGYFIPTEKEEGLILIWLRQEEAHQRTHLATLKGARKFLNRKRKGL